eukprot:CAMPEP_0195113868 /NCGR_PEP_ID=MMETSP0448-20130528/104112_1 /TAXON_ID=66468 /ORGANISM="Heterocapsa triquestra, Strain CCMP 448" /LENGTH=37 /DNA_ID= /DNA_START= /DNA_END= /DNA_ORIENTATION=
MTLRSRPSSPAPCHAAGHEGTTWALGTGTAPSPLLAS